MRWSSVLFLPAYWAFQVAILFLMPIGSATAQDAGLDMRADATSVSLIPEPDPRTAQVRALLAGTLDASISPHSLFDVPLEEEAAVEVEATRTRALLLAVDEATRPPLVVQAPLVQPRAETADGGSLRAQLDSVDPALWTQRIELDRARMDFYSLPQKRRGELLRAHAARQAEAHRRDTESERRMSEAAEERARVLAAARAARQEAERMVREELTRHTALEGGVRLVRDHFRELRAAIVVRRDTVLGWQRRARDAKAEGATEADATYDALRRALRASRDDLAAALDAIGNERSDVPQLGPNPLVDVPPDVSTNAVRERRAAVERAIAEARRDEVALHAEQASALLDEIDALNHERLGLLPALSEAKRDAVMGFTAAGWDQAYSEGRHLFLILRYHRYVAQTWIRTLHNNGARAVSPWRTAGVLLPLLVAVGAFLWGRRAARSLLDAAASRLAVADQEARRTSPSTAHRLVRLLLQIHRPLEWLLFFALALWLLPTGATSLLEVQLLASVVGWTVAGALIVNVTNALAARGTTGILSIEADPTGQLRLRSLRLIGRTVVLFALILVLSARLVGQGTIHSWVFSTCWFAAVPVLLLIVRWWRATVFERLDRIRKKSPLQAWILANRSGWKSFIAAMLGALRLFGTGALKLLRGWLSGFDVARRVHAYLFKREIERIGDARTRAELAPLPEQALDALHPEQPASRWLTSPNDRILAALLKRVSERRGGLVAVVGAQGMGKSALLGALSERLVDGSRIIRCDARMSIDDLQTLTGLGDGSELPESAQPRTVLLDEAQTLIKPCIGGLSTFDAVVLFARSRSRYITWVLSFDASLWQLLRRARDARPIFDETHHLEPWTEAQIGELLAERCERAQISPTYDDLFDRLRPDADEIDRQDALRAKRAGYERMLWDHVGGNPGLALEVWRSSLAQDAAGVVHVRPLCVPDVAKLERLPDTSLFILRAVLQMAPANVETVAQATRLRSEEVLQDFHFGKTHGFFAEEGGGIRVAWPWLRPVIRVLERRHLLVTP